MVHQPTGDLPVLNSPATTLLTSSAELFLVRVLEDIDNDGDGTLLLL
jgi:hypothetical protein